MKRQAHKAVLEFEDGYVEEVEVPEGTNVLAAAIGQGLAMASQCQSGSCGTCVARVVDGSTRFVEGRAVALLPSEISAGGRLLCSTVLDSDATFAIPYPSDLIRGPVPQVHRTTVRGVQALSETVRLLELELPARAGLDYRPGQYVRIRIPGTDEWRSYSMANARSKDGVLQFLVRMLPAGAMSDYLRSGCSAGDEVDVEGAFGSFVLRESKGHHLFVAGGTGLAPVIAMIDAIRGGRGRRTPMTLCFACNTESDLFYEEEIALRTAWVPNLEARVAVTSPTDGRWTGTVGTPVDLLRPDDVRADTTAYLCGPPGMIEAARQRLVTMGLAEERIHSEQFLASPT